MAFDASAARLARHNAESHEFDFRDPFALIDDL